MNWPGFHALSTAWLFLLIIPLVILYFLKLKRPTMRVPSLALWAAVMQDQRVNSPFQRFKRNLLLWLQLLILCLLVLSAMLPYFRGTSASDRVLILLDRSASMAALDKVGGATRLSVAKERIQKIIEGMAPAQELSIIAFDRSARQAVPFTNSHRVLLDGLEDIELREQHSDVVDALRMADAMARTRAFDRVLLISDGNIPTNVDFDLPFKLEFEKLPPAGVNFGITDLHARRDGARGWSVFVRVQGSAEADIPCKLLVIQDGEEAFSEDVHLGREAGQRFVFPIRTSGPTTLEFRLALTGFDALPVDNQAYLVLSEARPLRVLVDPKLSFFSHAMKVLENVDIDQSPDTKKTYDLVVVSKAEGAPQPLTSMYVGYVPDDLTGIVKTENLTSGTDTVTDWQRNNPLLEHVELSELFIGQRLVWLKDRSESDLDAQRYSVLTWGADGPLIVSREDGGLVRYHILFDPVHSTLPYRLGFPILCRNLVRVAMQRAGLLEVQGQRTGVMSPISLRPNTKYEIRGPGTSRQETTDSRGILTGIPAPLVGLYTITGGGDKVTLGTSLLSSSETALGTVDRLEMNELSVEAASAQVATDQSFWALLAAIALAVLLLEWWFFQARPGGFAVQRAA